MSGLATWAVGTAVGFALGGVHLLLFVRGFGVLMGAGDGSRGQQVWVVLSAGRFLVTLALALGLVRVLGLQPEAVGAGLIAAFTVWKIAAARRAARIEPAAPGAAINEERASLA